MVLLTRSSVIASLAALSAVSLLATEETPFCPTAEPSKVTPLNRLAVLSSQAYFFAAARPAYALSPRPVLRLK